MGGRNIQQHSTPVCAQKVDLIQHHERHLLHIPACMWPFSGSHADHTESVITPTPKSSMYKVVQMSLDTSEAGGCKTSKQTQAERRRAQL